ncbi:hypothetical protein [Alkalibacillus haloalkaliphilus]|uniref:hypothetical protein n=1 Tax=Alkalibacillus haloalkaliphilus TaxID=94136 RepID=UPI0029369FDB|nr:hypothetical protein [Alkalibacillus haloalkaliphilus]MDV2582794.1 hypothetical protein [Alkalibacillus haloalkaliphilus]
MIHNNSKKFNLWIPLLLLLLNVILTSFLIEELLDATEPNYGFLGFLTPIVALISLVYIRKFKGEAHGFLVRILQALNWLFIILPIAVFMVFLLAFL